MKFMTFVKCHIISHIYYKQNICKHETHFFILAFLWPQFQNRFNMLLNTVRTIIMGYFWQVHCFYCNNLKII